MFKVAIVTPWRDQVHFLPAWMQAVEKADRVVVIDNGSQDETKNALHLASKPMSSWVRVRREDNALGYGGACNLGLELADAEVVVMLNNDVHPLNPDWLAPVVEAAKAERTIVGAQLNIQHVAGVKVPYLDGWCLGARAETWQELGGFDAEAFHGFYWEDVDLSFRARLAGITLRTMPIGLHHIGNGTSSLHREAYEHSMRNRITFEKRVQDAQKKVSPC